MGNCDAEIDCEVNRVIDQILREDRLESLGSNPCPDTCETICEEKSAKPGRSCAIETSARFSIRILEALKAIQRQKCNDSWPSCSMKEVVQYIRRHYHYDGDLCSQVETALNQVTVEGFVLKIGVNRYHLVGPFASVLNPSKRCDVSNFEESTYCGSRSSRKRRRRRSGTAVTMSTFRDADLTMNPRLHSTILGMGGRAFQNRNNNWNRSLLRAPHHGHPFNEDQELSNLREINPADVDEPIGRPGGDYGGEHEAGNRSFHENEDDFNPPVPQHPLPRPGGGWGGRGGRINPPALIVSGQRGEVGDHSSDEDMRENENPIPANEAIRRPGCCGGPDPLPPAEHSSDENMFRMEPVVNVGGRRRGQQRPGRCRRRANSSGSRNNVNSARCSRRRCRKNSSTRHSEVDSSDYTNDEEDRAGKPWVRNCQVQESRASNRRGRKCSPCAFE